MVLGMETNVDSVRTPGRTYERWEGGRTYQTARGQVWVLRKQHAGKQVDITLDVRTHGEALAELALFTRDPVRYASAHAPRDSSLTKATIEAFLAAKAGTVSPEHAADLRRYLTQWAVDTNLADLSELTMGDLREALARHATARAKRIAALKALTAWLRAEGRLTRTSDPTLDLSAPTALPGRLARAGQKKGYAVSEVEAVYHALGPGPARDLLLVHARTGMHDSEIRRLAAGQGDMLPVADGGLIFGVVRVEHKSGVPHVQALTRDAYEALGRLRAGKVPNRSTVYHTLRAVAERNGLRPVDLGELRHSFATWAAAGGGSIVDPPKGAGVPLAVISRLLGHSSERTTARHYLHVDVPQMIVVPFLAG